MKKLNITFCSFPDYAGNSKALYEYMVNRYKNNMNYTWVVHSQEMLNILKAKQINAVLEGTIEYEKYISKTNVFFTTHANLIGEKSKAKNSIYVELWHGIGLKPIGYLTKKLNESDAKWYNFLRKNIDYIVVPTEMWRCLFAAMFDVNVTKILPYGLPLLDEIKNSDGKRNLTNLLNINVNKYNKLIYYMPTFKKGCGRQLESHYNKNNILNISNYDDNDLIKYLKKNNYLLIIKRHPSEECNYIKIENDYIKNIDNNMLINSNLNVNSILNAADILITDYSSIGVEFSFLDKPVIYLSTDIDEYRENRGIILNDYDFWTNKHYCSKYNELIKYIDKYIGKKHKVKNKKLIFGDLRNGGCDNLCNFLFHGYNINPNVIKEIEFNNRLLDESLGYKAIIEKQEKLIKKLTESDIELQEIKSSRLWKILEKVRRIIKR